MKQKLKASDIKVAGSKKEAAWERVKEASEQSILNCEIEIEIQKHVRLLATNKVLELKRS